MSFSDLIGESMFISIVDPPVTAKGGSAYG